MIDDNDFRTLLHRFNRPWSGYRKVRKGVMKRIRRHMRSLSVSDIKGYLRTIDKDLQARRVCEECLLITISRFFRDRNLWNYLGGQVLPELALRFPAGLRAWSIGCGCGEEVYSLSIIWRQQQPLIELQILSTDINPANLERARKGRYGSSSMKEVAKQLSFDCFVYQTSSSNWMIKEEYRKNITWQRHDLFSPPPVKETYHLIFLRNNLLTYHQGDEMKKAFHQILSSLTAGGYLVVGSHEQIPEGVTYLEKVSVSPFLFKAR